MVERCPDKTEVDGSIPSTLTICILFLFILLSNKALNGFIFVEDNKQNLNKGPSSWGKGPWWKPAFEIFSEISTWIAVPIILAVVAGKALDNHYGTKPWIFIGFVVISFLFSSFGLVRSVRKYADKIKESEKEIKNKEIK